MLIFVDENGSRYYLIYRPYRKDPATGKILYAKAYGYRAWPIRIYI